MPIKPISNEDIRLWLRYIRYNFSEYTYATYKAALKSYIDWCKRKTGKALFPTWKAIQMWLDYLSDIGMKGMTRHTYYRALKNFLRFHDMDDVIREFEKKGRVPRFKVTRTDTLTRKQVETLEAKADTLEMKLIVRLLFVLGLRISELCRLRESDFDPEKHTLRVTSRKKRGGVTYYTYVIDSDTASMVKRWLEIKPASKWMFPSPKNPDKPVTTRGVRERLYNLSIRALGRRIHPHMIRHTLGTLLAKKGVPAQFIAVYLRDTIPSTERYVHMSPEQVSEEIIKILMEKAAEPEEKEEETLEIPEL